ncbi:cytochrome P450 [Polymorphospora rubra]|uniref:cytochrome P450 n=1 Tax=Polymorphospora rubra TaxID=338584 RepID=UPI0033D92ACE
MTVSYPFTAPSMHEPAPEFGELREKCPVAAVTLPDGTPAWLVTRHEDVRQVLVDPRFSRAAATAPGGPQSELGALTSESLIGLDPPRHTRLRRLVASGFTPRRVEQLRPRVAELVGGMIDTMEGLPRPVDLVANLSMPLPVQVIFELFGVSPDDRDAFLGWSAALMGKWDRDPERTRAALDGFAGLIAAKRAAPADDLLTALITARDEQDQLTERELVMLCIGVLIGGHETTANQINLFLLTLLRERDRWERLVADPEALPHAIEELLRFVQLGESGVGQVRLTTEEVTLGDTVIPAGAAVLPAMVAANRDPAVFTEPDHLDLARADNPHLAFGGGIHYCLGAQLARMELQEVLGALLRRMPGLRIAVAEEELRFRFGMAVRSLETLPVTW